MRRGVGDRADFGVLLGAETQLGGDVAYAVEFGIVLHVEEFDILADDPGQDGLGDIDDFASLASTNRARVYQVSVEMAAAGALDRLGDEAISEQQGLHFA